MNSLFESIVVEKDPGACFLTYLLEYHYAPLSATNVISVSALLLRFRILDNRRAGLKPSQ